MSTFVKYRQHPINVVYESHLSVQYRRGWFRSMQVRYVLNPSVYRFVGFVASQGHFSDGDLFCRGLFTPIDDRDHTSFINRSHSNRNLMGRVVHIAKTFGNTNHPNAPGCATFHLTCQHPQAKSSEMNCRSSVQKFKSIQRVMHKPFGQIFFDIFVPPS